MGDTVENFDLSSLKIRRDAPEAPRGRKTRWIIVFLSVVFAAVAATFALKLKGGKPVEIAVALLSGPGGASSGGLTASGYIVPQRRASVASKGTGRLVALNVQEGDRVKSGQEIARIEDQDIVAALNQTKAQLEISKVELVDAERSLKRDRHLLDSSAISQTEFETAETRRDRSAAQVRVSEASLSASQVALENTRIRAPFDGTVLTKEADVGEVVAPFASSASSKGSVVTLADMSSLMLEADVSESSIERIRVGQPCEIILDAYPDKRYRGVVDKIVPTVNRAKATILTKVKFLDIDHKVLPDMSAKATFMSETSAVAADAQPSRLVIPRSALVDRDGKTAVYLVSAGHLTSRDISVGSTFSDRIEVRSGLTLGDSIVNHPSPDLTSGDRVQLKKE